MKTVYFSLGSNLGNPKKNLEDALELLKEKVQITKVSSFYETEPVGYDEQDWFLNLAVEGKTQLEPYPLLEFCQGIEKSLKRIKTIRFGPRIIDVDILLYEGCVMDEERLTLPHPRMTERAFVLVPLCEIAPDLSVQGVPIQTLLKSLDGEEIRKWEEHRESGQ